MIVSPEQEERRINFRIAVGQDCMGWFCAKHGWGKLEYEASSPIDLIRLVAEKIVQVEKEEKHERDTAAAVVGVTGASAASAASSTGEEGGSPLHCANGRS